MGNGKEAVSTGATSFMLPQKSNELSIHSMTVAPVFVVFVSNPDQLWVCLSEQGQLIIFRLFFEACHRPGECTINPCWKFSRQSVQMSTFLVSTYFS